jgi:uncharacterized protein (DUF1330 family)
MAKAYWIATYQSVRNPEGLAEYAKLAGPAIQAGGGKFLARGDAAKLYEAAVGKPMRTVVIEFESVAQAIATHDSPAYQAAVKALAGGVDRDLRIVEALA